LQIRDANGQHATFNLDSGLWKRLGNKGFRYKDKKRQAGPCTKVTFKAGTLINLACSGSAITLRTPLASPVELVLSLGDSSYCAVFGGRITRGPGRFDARGAAKPSSCPLAQGTP